MKKHQTKKKHIQSKTKSSQKRQNEPQSRKKFQKTNNIPKKQNQQRSVAPHEDSVTPHAKNETSQEKGIRLNKYVANAGICSRRKADEFIEQGLVKVNGKVITQMGHKVQVNDLVTFKDKKISPDKKAYVLLNKPKNTITTTHDPQGRKTVMDLIKRASTARLYPVGRLDRHTTGLLLLTNDGQLAQKLMHPSHEVQKVYHVFLNKPLIKSDFQKIQAGVTLKDGNATIDELAYPNPKDRSEIGIALHIGRNRIVRRIFEHLGYEVKKLDRVRYGALTKKDLPRGRWRYLEEKEIILLKHFSRKKVKKART